MSERGDGVGRGRGAGLCALAFALALTLGCGSPGRDLGPSASAPPPEVARRRAPPVDAARLAELFAGLPESRGFGRPGHAAARVWIREQLTALGLEVVEQGPGPDEPARYPLVNLEARTPSEDSFAPLLLLGAHYDSVPVSPGADDNGSGVVATLALAERLVGRELGLQLGFVFFDAEEPGLFGSRFYANRLDSRDRRRLVGLINLETMAYRDTRPGSQTLPPGFELLVDAGDRGDFIALLGNVDSEPLARRVALGLASQEPSGLRTVVFSAIPGAGWMLPDTRRSDHASFWDIRVPAVMLTDTANFRSPHYHTRGDVVETLDLEFLAAIVRGVERAVLLLAAES